MFQALKSIFSTKEPVDFKELLKNGASIIDVRTLGEFKGGHIKGSKNIPLQTLQNNFKKIDQSKPVIVCCASGARSSSAKRLLESNGFTDVYNGGGWQILDYQLQ
tara:strand:+ start:57836 stop:58150 length:315 start_codon:yes stop_codon:yes gene_type:complete